MQSREERVREREKSGEERKEERRERREKRRERREKTPDLSLLNGFARAVLLSLRGTCHVFAFGLAVPMRFLRPHLMM